MPTRKAVKRPEKLQCRPGYVQRGAACQKISSKGGIAKKAGLALGGAIAAYVAASAAAKGRKEQEISPLPPIPDATKSPSSWKRKALTSAAIAGGVVGGSITTASIARHVKTKMAEREAKRAEEAAQQATWMSNAEEREQRLQSLAYDEINGEKAHPNLAKNLRKFEDSIKDNNFETIGIFGADGDEWVNKKGEKYEVQLTRAETMRVQWRSSTENLPVLSHNHPTLDGKHSASFSIDDVDCAGVLRVGQLRVVNRDDVFIMNPPKGQAFSPELTKKIEKAYNQRLQQKEEEYRKKVRQKMHLFEANMRMTHEVWELVAKDVPEITYQKIPRGNSRYVKGYSDG